MENNKNFRDKIPEILIITLVIGFYLAFFAFVKGKVPDAETLISIAKNLYGAYGYYIIFLGALLEGTFIVGLYLPGATVVLLGAALSKTGVIQFPIALGIGIAGFMSGYIINYFLGKYGWYRVLNHMGLKKGIDIAKAKLENNETRTILLGYFHPGSASFLSTAAGVMKIPIKRFLVLSFIAQLFWSLVWGSIAYLFGVTLVELFLKYFGFVVIGAVGIWLLRKYLKK
ncbi:MAG: hypothetical protein ACD_50C00117G0008 [uncultured bacterium]|nr:MAG: hypothetical protein ACD_50C00117G0008 [uncultured bacterium]OGH14768.1 MAG: hypothetical protein A2687_02860 [Candidatus Levybacteria bacterium RIFCSPHIGHO2_01_FULL_38_26]